jgi:glycosyltransferase involved in cell wall biosynthesis
MAVQGKSSDDPTVVGPASRLSKLGHEIVSLTDRVPLALYRRRAAVSFDLQWIGSCSATLIAKMEPDLVHLHWVTGGFLGIGTLSKFRRPIIWTLRDMWPFTGGCHYSVNCDRYRAACGACCQLGSHTGRDITRWVWWRKSRAWRPIDLHLVAPSRWMADCARSSSLFGNRPITIIPNGVDISIFKPLDRGWARRALGLEPDRQMILFGAVNVLRDSNKGAVTLQEALPALAQRLAETPPQLLIVGSSAPAQPPGFGLETRYLGQIGDETTMALAYNAADLLVVPSRQESFCQIAAEALACGTPVVAFDTTGLRDIIDHRVNGYLARPYDASDLAGGILWILASDARKDMAPQARQKVLARFALGTVVRQYLDLYQEVLGR